MREQNQIESQEIEERNPGDKNKILPCLPFLGDSGGVVVRGRRRAEEDGKRRLGAGDKKGRTRKGLGFSERTHSTGSHGPGPMC